MLLLTCTVFTVFFCQDMDIHTFHMLDSFKENKNSNIWYQNSSTRIWKNADAFIYMRFKSLLFLLPAKILCLKSLHPSLTSFLHLLLCLQSHYVKLFFFNGQYATVCIFHEFKPRETYACTETWDLISFKKDFLWQNPKCKYAYTGTKQCSLYNLTALGEPA